ncbi:type I secretion system permease/ATPase [Azospirillum melinis]|uniref:Type I secretion system permease/ATPase n=1 Tax=Azospirillum melinis TaxID=328839 RepID=A0ABX2KSS0_9PROT|nr:type I secretion system permease/ATPase [Azospirillum melinis]MBP2305524.1 subfamily B ATP-binding cassette protein HlyB/CyaB [Azospirillum melinis]NUB02934.1 type I secretion system permease/ATPase [Azospirillum melinis]
MPRLVEDSVTPDTGLSCLIFMLRLMGHPADPEQIRHDHAVHGRAMETLDILRAAKRFGLKARSVTTSWDRLAATPLPAIAKRRDGRYFIIAKIDGDRVLIQDPLESKPLALPRAVVEPAWAGELVLMARRAGLDLAQVRFGIGWFVPALLKYRRLFSEILLASFMLQVFGLISPLFFQVVVDKVLAHRSLTTLDILVVGLVVVSLFETVLGGLRSYLFSHTTSRVDVTLGARLFDHLLALPLPYFQARRVGDNVARVRELDRIRDFLTGSALTLVIDLVFTVVFLAVMWWYSPALTGIVLASLPVYAAISLAVTPVLRRRLEAKFALGAENQAFLVESISGIETLKAMAVEPEMRRHWEERLAAYVGAAFRASSLGVVAGQGVQLVSKLTMAALLYVGAQEVIDGALTIGALVAVNMLAGRVSSPVLRLAQLWNDFQQARVSVERLADILNTTPEPAAKPGRLPLPAIRGRIRFDRVGFCYRPDASPTLQGIDLTVEAGETVGIVGSSGSGKSTLTKLVQRLYVPESGRVLIDDVDLSLVDVAWLRRQIGVVLQENVLFNRSIRDNIALADPGMPMERIVEAARLAGADRFILGLPEGYDTVIGERGASLSGGQRQRVAIARALATDPRILIFDEATSALDVESEAAIQANMRRICDNRTVLIVAHRLSTVRGCDRIVTVEEGRIAEQGTHDELIRLGGRYAALWRMQAGGQAEVDHGVA